jgi:hypothetical protein
VARRKVVTGLLLAAGSLVGAIAYRRRYSNRRARVDLYYDDGSMVSLAEGSPDGDRLLPLARDVLGAARG